MRQPSSLRWVWILGAVIWGASNAGTYTFPFGDDDGGEPCIPESTVLDREQAAYETGLAEGTVEGIAQCTAQPGSCGITLQSLIPAAEYGETEFNDNMVAADPLIAAATFWGQSYAQDDQDWYYLVSDAPNKTLTVMFSVPDRDAELTSAGDWVITIRDAAGNIYAAFNTDFLEGNPNGDDAIAYPVTLGLTGTYYVVVTPEADSLSAYPYNLSVTLEDSALDTPSFIIGSFDAEVEPNDFPQLANPVVSGVTMYGLVNVRFDGVVNQDGSYVWGQGEDDWYAYETDGDEIINMSFCERDQCSDPGQWYVEVYSEEVAQDGDGLVAPMAAFNYETDELPETIVLGLSDPGTYYFRVNHKRLITAPCTGYELDSNNDGLADAGACGCESGYTCDIQFDVGFVGPGFCPDGSQLAEGARQCPGKCRCTSFGVVVEVPEGIVSSQYNFTWLGTKLGPFTDDTDAYDDFQDRPSFFNQDDVHRAYIAYYDRPGDPAGVDYWKNRLAGDPGGLDALMSEFASSAEAVARYGHMTDEELLQTLYEQLFGREMDEEGRAYYTAELAAGTTTPDQLIMDVIKGAQHTDAAMIANKVELARYFTGQVRALNRVYADEYIEPARGLMRQVTENPASVTDLKPEVDALIASMPSAG